MSVTAADERYAYKRFQEAVRAGLLAELPPAGLGGYAALWRQFSGSDYFRNAAKGAGYADPGYYLRVASRGQAPQVMPAPQIGGPVPAPPANPAAPHVPFPVDQSPGTRGGDPAGTPLGALLKALGAFENPGNVILEPTTNITGPGGFPPAQVPRRGRYGPQ